MPSLLDVRNLKTYYSVENDTVKAVNGVSFHVEKGETLGIAGESGCGKTTAAYSIARLLPSAGKIVEGQVLYKGNNLLQYSDQEFRTIRWNEISMVFQSALNSLNPVVKVGDQISDAIQFHKGVTKKNAMIEVEKLFKKVGLGLDRINHYPFEFSGGMKQRAVIALSLSCDPSLIILDEPITALDVSIQAQILETLGELIKEQQMSTILITHDLSVIAETCDKAAIMYAGKIVEFGDTKDVFVKPIHPYTKGLIDAIPNMEKAKEKQLFTIPGEPPDLISNISGCSFQPRCPYSKLICSQKTPGESILDGRVVECFFAEEIIHISGQDFYGTGTEGPTVIKKYGQKILDISNLKKTFPVRTGFFSSLLSREEIVLKAVDDISFYLKKGEILGLVGESGCGKTTTAKCLVKLYEPSDGNIYLSGLDIVPLKRGEFKKHRKKIQMLFQDPYDSIDPRQRVYDVIAEPLRIHNLKEGKEYEKVTDLLLSLKLVPPGDYINKYPYELSGGERQRVALARALSLNPQIIVADEPVSMLDVSIKAGVLNILLELRETHETSIILITHDLAVASYLSDRLAVMYLGKIIEIGPTETIVNNPLHPYTKGLINSVPSPDPLNERRRTHIQGEPPSPINLPSGCSFRERCQYANEKCNANDFSLKKVSEDHYVSCLLFS